MHDAAWVQAMAEEAAARAAAAQQQEQEQQEEGPPGEHDAWRAAEELCRLMVAEAATEAAGATLYHHLGEVQRALAKEGLPLPPLASYLLQHRILNTSHCCTAHRILGNRTQGIYFTQNTQPVGIESLMARGPTRVD